MSDLELSPDEISPDLGRRLRSLTPARVALGRSGDSLATRELLAFQRDHAMARDAVHATLNAHSIAAEIGAMTKSPVVRLRSAAKDRATYLQRPDLGRKLDAVSQASLNYGPFDLAILIADGLSAIAVERHAPALLQQLLPALAGVSVAPLMIVEQGRVAIGDEIGAALGAQISVVLIGERPGLSSPDSLGAYITWKPRIGRTDAERNCISNIRAQGLSYAEASGQIAACIQQARSLQLTGTGLKLDAHLLNG